MLIIFFEKQHKCLCQWNLVKYLHFNSPYQSFKIFQNSNGTLPSNCWTYIYIYNDWALYDDIFELLEVCPNLTYYTKSLNLSTFFQILKEQDQKLWITWNIYIY